MATITYCKYRRKRKQRKVGEAWYDYSPQEYAKGELVACGLAECEASPSTPPFLPPSSSKYERWVTVEGGYLCSNGNKYYKLMKQVSDDGENFADAVPAQYMEGELIEAGSPDCGGLVAEEWKPVPGEYMCVGDDKHGKLQLYEYGQAMQEFKAGELIEADSADCGHEKVEWKAVEGGYVCEKKYPDYCGDDNVITYESNDGKLKYKLNNASSYSTATGGTLDLGKDTVVTRIRFTNGSTTNYLSKLNLSRLCTANITSMSSMFSLCEDLASLDVRCFDTSNVTDMRYMFNYCEYLKSLDVSGFNTSNVTSMNSMFSHCYKLQSLDVSGWNTSNVTDMNSMFTYCYALQSLDVSGFNTSKVTDMYGMFFRCSSLPSLDLSKWDTSNVTIMSNLFNGCSSLQSLDVSNFNTSKVDRFISTFEGCSSLTSLDLSSWDNSNVYEWTVMFRGCSKLQSLDISGWGSPRMDDVSAVFEGCTSLNHIRCKQAFKDWCTKNKAFIKLDNFDAINWEIVG